MKKTKSFSACDSGSHEGLTNTWFTPKNIISKLGYFDLDPCTQSYRPFDIAKHNYCEDKGINGLREKWRGRVFLNPPYGKKIYLWLRKFNRHKNGIALVFARTETIWAQEIMKRCEGILFIKGRLSFLRWNGEKSSNAGTGSMLLAYGKENIEALRNIEGILIINNKDFV